MTEAEQAEIVEVVLVGKRPQTSGQWAILRLLSCDVLKKIGLGSWDGRLMLFPVAWYEHIPAGYVIEYIDGGTEAFKPGETDDDYRAGFLAYGVPAIDGVVVGDR